MAKGAPRGNRNALKTGRHSAEARALRRCAWVLIARARNLAAMNASPSPLVGESLPRT